MKSAAFPDNAVQVQGVDRRHNPAMLAILGRSPVETGGLTLCFDRQPDIFTMTDLKYDPPVWRGLFESGTLVGFGVVGYHKAYVNGSAQPVFHITDCYVEPEFRGRGYLTAAVPYFLEEAADRTSLGYTVVLKGNRNETLTKQDRFSATPCGLRSRTIGELTVQSLFLLPRRKRSHLPVRRARMDDIDDIVSLLRAEHLPRLFGLVVGPDQFAAQLRQRPGLSIDDYFVVEKAGKLLGVCAAWDTGSFKQERV